MIEERGSVLALLLGPGSRVPTLVDDHGAVRRFLVEIICASFDLTAKQANVIAELYSAIASGAVASWAQGLASRRFIEDLVVRFTHAGVVAVANADR